MAVPATVRVLVIDDNDFVRDLVAGMLREIGFQDIVQACDGHDALGRLETADPGLIICDVAMKPMDGLAFVEALRQHAWPRATEVPVIFLTVHTEPRIVKRAAKLGVEAYVVKPVQKKQLEARVMTILERGLTRRP
jgi:two-component system, chemotaxis family, chemotaxis protein CheY